jgi:ribosomal protein S27AE
VSDAQLEGAKAVYLSEINRLRAALAGRDAWIAGAVRLLQQLEWSAVWRNQRACPACGNAIAEHLDDCPLKAALDTAPGPVPQP